MRSFWAVALFLAVAGQARADSASDGAVTGAETGKEAAAPSAARIDFGPFVGTGSLSSGAHVRNASGYGASYERTYALNASGLTLGPRVELFNSFVTARAGGGGETQVFTYDNRVFAAGVVLGQVVPALATAGGIPRLYVSAEGGRGFSKLSVDDSTVRSFNQSLYTSLSGSYGAAELGTFFPLKGNLGVSLAVVGAVYTVNQGQASGTRDGNALASDNTVYSLDGNVGQGQASLPTHEVMRTYSARMALALGF